MMMIGCLWRRATRRRRGDQVVGAEAIFRMGVLADWPVHVIPDVHAAPADHVLEVFVAEDLVEVFLGDGAGGAKKHPALFQALHTF